MSRIVIYASLNIKEIPYLVVGSENVYLLRNEMRFFTYVDSFFPGRVNSLKEKKCSYSVEIYIHII